MAKRKRRARLRRPSGTGSVFERASDGRWAAQLTTDGVTDTRYAQTEDDAYALLDQMLCEREEAKRSHEPGQTVGEWLARWMEDTAKYAIRPHTWDAYRSRLKHVVRELGTIPLDALRPTDVSQFQAKLLRQGLKPSTVWAIRMVFHTAMEEAVRQEIITRNVVHQVRAPRVERPPMHPLTAVQLRRLLHVSEGTRWHALWYLLGSTGLRLGEALGLEWRHVHDGVVDVQQTKTHGVGRGHFLGPPKSATSKRTVDVPEGAQRALEKHRAIVADMRVGARRWDESRDLVFPSTVGTLMGSDVAEENFRKDLDRAGIPPRTPHELRHTAASLHLERGTHPRVVQEILGHSSGKETERYSHVAPRLHTNAAREMDAMLTSEPDMDSQTVNQTVGDEQSL